MIRFAIQTGRAEYDPTFALKGALNPIVVTPRAALTEETQFGRLLAAIDERQGWLSLTRSCFVERARATLKGYTS